MNSHLSYRAELDAALGAAQARYRALHDDPQASDAAMEAALADGEVRYWCAVGEPAAPEAAEILGQARARAAEAGAVSQAEREAAEEERPSPLVAAVGGQGDDRDIIGLVPA